MPLTTAMLRAIGAALLVLSLTPIFRILRPAEDAPVRAANLSMAEGSLELAWWGSLIVVLLALVLARMLPEMPGQAWRAAGRALSRPSPAVFGAWVVVVATGGAVIVVHLLFQGLLTNVDEMASLIHARYLGLGRLAGPALTLPEAWLIPNMLMVPEGWVSQYPPSHLAVIAAFDRMGVPLAAGPVLFGAMAGLVALTLPRLAPERVFAMRAAALLTALSPMLLFLAGGLLSHLTAGTALALAAYAAIRARDGRAAWAVVAGGAIGMAVSARPLTGLVLGALFPVALWWPRVRAGGLGWGARRVAALLAGGLPFAVALGAYHARVFGGVAHWGYLAAFGADHGLGFHPDPWGYDYGPREALALTSTDLVQLGVQLLETPVPLTAVLGLWLVVAPRLPRGSSVLVAWAFLPVAANAAYWFHAPRMYYESATAWIAITVLGLSAMVGHAGSQPDHPDPAPRRIAPVLGWAALLALGWAVVLGTPARWASYAWDETALASVRAPDPPPGPPALVFVHTPWTERITATLQGAGEMRQDSVTVALRRNGTCSLHAYAAARERRVREGAPGALPVVDSSPRAGTPAGLERRYADGGTVIRVRTGESLTDECARELVSDRFGTVALAPLLWQGDLPGDERGDPMFVRDLGPDKNELLRAAYPERTPFVFVPRAMGAPPELVPYEEAMRVLWGGR
ncbi:MAG: hypothetical protein WEA34_00495 [Gemmatimonadota bacterium]